MSEQEAREQTGVPTGPVEPDPGSVEPDAPAPAEYDPTFRTIPAAFRILLSLLSGAPLVVSGLVMLINADLGGWVPVAISYAGVGITLVGLYFSFAGSRPRLNLLPGEKTLALRHPSVKPAFVRMVISLGFFAASGYVLFLDQAYAVLYFALFLAGVYLHFRGVIRFWLIQHTTYYVTDRRAVHMYRFAALNTTELPVSAINSISETRNFFEMITGRGTVIVASGIGNFHRVRMQEIDNPGPMARVIRQQLS